MADKQLEDIFSKAKPIEEGTETVADLAGYQVTKAELFSHTREPAITIWPARIRFNMACLRRFPGITHIQILIHPGQKRLIIRPCLPDAPDSLRWAKGSEKERASRDMLCRIFAAKVFDLMGWDGEYRYKVMGNPAVYQNEMLFLFKLTDFELFAGGSQRHSYLPGEWRDYFGVPAERHEDSYKIDLADGYITTESV
ncbi:hypothetical protein AALD01_17895 [Oscillospiraceae bacterium 21-37]|jgi:hypothetical protein|uniref:hypothetical protein n=1 Tax=Eubacteriales TaxID=186802 RepID=UPI00136FE71C|nr:MULTISPECIES: hypothetical protein [unclassified Neglectibacter]MCI9115730.1 hypothetical protein [Acutalibacter sp.]NBI17935.1 hypothetical protein [Neglectibacter sp. 59]NBJ73660.1 hypothetical protein [Neglectibacter sp. X4]NCE81395.1 hypothetical protein [Neglectibacter sp. X58]